MSLEKYRFDSAQTKKYLEDEATYAFVLLAILLAYLPEGEDDLTKVDLDEVLSNMQDDFGCKIADECANKIQAAVVALTTDYFWTDVNVMKGMSLTLDDGDIGDLLDNDDEEVDTCQILWAAMEVGLINDMTFEQSLDEFTDKVSNVINKVIESEAQDLEEVEDDVDTIEEATRKPYYGKVVDGKLMMLVGQLINLAGDNEDLRKELESVGHEMLVDNGIDTE